MLRLREVNLVVVCPEEAARLMERDGRKWRRP
jgi:hypothetical protein